MPLINYISNPSFSTMCLSTHSHEPLLTAPSQLSGPRPRRTPPLTWPHLLLPLLLAVYHAAASGLPSSSRLHAS